MPSNQPSSIYLTVYRLLVRLYPRPFYRRFGPCLEQTFNDLLRERAAENRNLLGTALWLYAETTSGILRERAMDLHLNHKAVMKLAAITGFLLMIPLIAMRFTTEVNWTLSDFIAAGALIFGSGLIYLLVANPVRSKLYRVAVASSVGSALFLTWVNLAVGIIGGDNNPINYLYFAVPIVGFLGAALARLRAGGMALTLFAMAGTVMLVPVIALAIRQPDLSSAEIHGVIRIFILNAFLASLFIVSGLIFRQAKLVE